MRFLKRLLREPLLHFLLLGAAVFALFEWTAPPAAPGADDKRIEVSEAQMRQLADRFRTTWRRPPTTAELENILNAYLREEILVREARALSMDSGDAVIRQRLAQKMTFLMESAAGAQDPDEATLQAFFEANIDRYRAPSRISFEQVFLGEAPTAEEVQTALTALSGGADPGSLGRATLLPPALSGATEREVNSTFGSRFLAALDRAEPGAWTAPVTSGYGVHAVRVVSRDPGARPDLQELRDRVVTDWRTEQAVTLSNELYDRMRSKYQIVKPDAETMQGLLK